MTVVAQNASEGLRVVLSLDGEWTFQHESDAQTRLTTVPNPWQAEFPDLRYASGRATYSRSFTVPAEWGDGTLVLRFGAVSYLAEINLNGERIGSHEGGYLPFEVVLPPGTCGENRLEVTATLPSGDRLNYPDHAFAEIPHGKQSWYGPLGGIWQSVTLERRAVAHLTACSIEADPDGGAVRARLTFSADADVAVSVLSSTGQVVATGNGRAAQGQFELTLAVTEPVLWSPDTPRLYQLQVDVAEGSRLDDRTTHSFGFRKIETRDGKLFLNDRPLYMRGALDQDYYPEGICTPPSLEFIEDHFRKSKELGLNLLRCHIKVPDPRSYEVADRIGMLIWTEIPNVGSFTKASARRMRDTMQGILDRDGNHPSIICWTIINEDWGTRLIENADHRAWLKETFDWLKAKDPARLVVDNSPCIPNFHVKTDLNDYHYYRSVPERRTEWEQLTEEFAAGADWTFSQHGDAERRGDEPLIVSEFGVWGLPNPKQVANSDGSEPWWMETGFGWGDGAAYPHGVQQRFSAYHMAEVFGSFDAFIDKVQWYQFDNLKYQIESMRARQPIQGYVITEITDVHWEANGLLDICRNPRVFHQRFAEINADLAIVPRVDRYSGWCGQLFSFGVAVATGGLSVPAGAVLEWALEDGPSGTIPVPPTGALEVADLTPTQLVLPQYASTRLARLAFILRADERELARNSVDLSVFTARAAPGDIRLHAKEGSHAAFLQGLGYTVVPANQADVIVAPELDALDIEAMRLGARYLVLSDPKLEKKKNLRSDGPLREPPSMPVDDEQPGHHMGHESQLPNVALHPRQGTIWRGDWIASFSWIKRSGPFSSLPGGPMLDLAYDRVVPRHVLGSFKHWEYDGLVHAGLVVGWVHKLAATIAERRVGRGGLVATTFRLMQDLPGVDPVAAALLDGL
ncbi:MAG: hypothetical protein JWR39_2173, partial [Devosia sp.]|nr:hypothetical protein [Devosia sp.]